MPNYPHIQRYYSARQELIEFGGSDSELNIRPAFQNCLAAYCGERKDRVIDLLKRVCDVSVRTMGIVDRMAYWEGDELIVFDDRENDELDMLAMSQWADET